MKFATVSKSFVMGLALLLASSAFAASKASLILDSPAIVNGTKLKAGEYKLQWDGSGPNVQLSIMQGKDVMVKTSAKVVDLSTAPRFSSATVNNNQDGTASLTEVRFAGKKFALDIGDTSEGMQAESSK